MKKYSVNTIFKGVICAFIIVRRFLAKPVVRYNIRAAILGIIGGIALTFFLLYLLSFINKAIQDIVFATGIMAIGTLVLAFFTYWNIHSRNEQDKRDRTERMLGDILEWATDVAKCSLEGGVFDETIPVSGLAAETALQEILRSGVVGFRMARARSVYISNIASEFNPELKKSTANLTGEIKKQIKIIIEYKRKLTPTWPADQVVAKISGNNERIYNLATKVIDDATNILKADLFTR